MTLTLVTVGWIILLGGCVYALSRHPDFRASLRYQEDDDKDPAEPQ